MTHRPLPPSRRRALVAAALLTFGALAAGCSAPSDDPAAITADEDRQLNQAAAQLDAAANTAPAAANESPAP